MTLRPRLGARDLPELTTAPPRGGWTVEAASAAAWQYAREHAAETDVVPRVLARCAWLAVAATDPQLSRADLLRRLSTNGPPAPGLNPKEHA